MPQKPAPPQGPSPERLWAPLMNSANQNYNTITDGIFGVIAFKTRSAVCSNGGFHGPGCMILFAHFITVITVIKWAKKSCSFSRRIHAAIHARIHARIHAACPEGILNMVAARDIDGAFNLVVGVTFGVTWSWPPKGGADRGYPQSGSFVGRMVVSKCYQGRLMKIE